MSKKKLEKLECFGEELNFIREQRKLTIDKLAVESGIPEERLNDLENGKPVKKKEVKLLAKALRIPSGCLLLLGTPTSVYKKDKNLRAFAKTLQDLVRACLKAQSEFNEKEAKKKKRK